MGRVINRALPIAVRYCRARLGEGDRAGAAAERACVSASAKFVRGHRDPLSTLVYREAIRESYDEPAPGWLAQVEPLARAVLILRVVEALPVPETAAILDVGEGRVRLLQHRALVTLRSRVA